MRPLHALDACQCGLLTTRALSVVVGSLFAVLHSFIGASRFIYSFARDRGFPGPLNKPLAWVDPRTKAPVGAILFFLMAGASPVLPPCYAASESRLFCALVHRHCLYDCMDQHFADCRVCRCVGYKC